MFIDNVTGDGSSRMNSDKKCIALYFLFIFSNMLQKDQESASCYR